MSNCMSSIGKRKKTNVYLNAPSIDVHYLNAPLIDQIDTPLKSKGLIKAPGVCLFEYYGNTKYDILIALH